MSELFVYESDDDNITYTSKSKEIEEKLIQKTDSEVSDQTIKNTSPDSVHSNKLEFPLSHDGGVS